LSTSGGRLVGIIRFQIKGHGVCLFVLDVHDGVLRIMVYIANALILNRIRQYQNAEIVCNKLITVKPRFIIFLEAPEKE
jgi:hypothetical protein